MCLANTPGDNAVEEQLWEGGETVFDRDFRVSKASDRLEILTTAAPRNPRVLPPQEVPGVTLLAPLFKMPKTRLPVTRPSPVDIEPPEVSEASENDDDAMDDANHFIATGLPASSLLHRLQRDPALHSVSSISISVRSHGMEKQHGKGNVSPEVNLKMDSTSKRCEKGVGKLPWQGKW